MSTTTTPSANYTALVAYIVSVVPEIMDWCGCGTRLIEETCHRCETHDASGRPITLEDGLRVIKHNDRQKLVADKTVVDFLVEEHGVWMENCNGHYIWPYGTPLSGLSRNQINWLVSLFPILK